MQRSTEEIRLIDYAIELWRGRHIVFFSTIVGAVVAAFVVLLTPKEYTARCEFLQQTTSAALSPRIASLASLAGISLPATDQVEVLPASLYENIVCSEPFLRQLIHYPLRFAHQQRDFTIVEYLGEDDGREGLREWIKSVEARREPVAVEDRLTAEEYDAIKYLRSRIAVEYDVADGYVLLEVTLPDAVASAHLTEKVVQDLEHRVIELKVERVRSNMLFIERRYDEARERFDSLQAARADYLDANQHTTRNSAKATFERIDAEYMLAKSIYEQLAMQLEQARIRVKEQTPVLSIFSPVTIPFKPSRPRKMIIFITFVALGFIVGASIIFVRTTIAELRGYHLPAPAADDEAKNH